MSRIKEKDEPKVGKIYSPRSQSMGEPGFICHRNIKQSKTSILSSFRSNKGKKNNDVDILEQLKNSRQMKVKVVDYNCKFQDSVDFSAKGNSLLLTNENNCTKEEGTQSRAIPIEPICISEQE